MLSNSVIKSVRNLRNVVATNVNRARGVEFIPSRLDNLSIETSSLCNLDCIFCAYGKKQSAKVTMPDEMFASCVTQAVELGYTNYDLTPCTGDVFMDRRIFNKFDFLDTAPGVQSYGFYTNFCVPRGKDIERLVKLKRLNGIGVSVYGHDLESFLAISRSTESVYHRLVRNLEHMLDILTREKFPIHIQVHPGRDSIRGRKSELITLFDKFKAAGVTVRLSKGLYNNWGGYITNEDVAGLPIGVVGEDAIYKNGACVRLFTTIQIMATGIVNGCACRDADATLQLGDLNKGSLRDIVSPENPAYLALIEEQQRGDFRPVCKSCDFYASIYHKSSTYRKNDVPLHTLAEWRETVR
jgi:MoaA/NifB/PqqE/SkfB family radical SAM enzyme